MRESLRFGDLSEEEINLAYRELIHLLRNLDPLVSFQLANSVWHIQEESPLEAFVQALEEFFQAQVRGIDFGDPTTPDTINRWVREKTEGRIEEIVPDPIPGNVVMYLLNAIHFLGDWTYQFDSSDTRDGPFLLPDGSSTTVKYMSREGGFRHYGHRDFTALELPYGGGAFAMTVLLPREVAGLPELVASLNDELWGEITGQLVDAAARSVLRFPRFTLTWERSFLEALDRMGMGIAFGGDADFSRIFGGPGLFISEVLQKTFLRVDEEGTEAAAVTSVELSRTSGPPTFQVDRPFLLAIRERLSGTILFLGAISEAPLD
jgi:serine protease inhibitor